MAAVFFAGGMVDWANESLRRRNEKPLTCPPGKLGVTTEQYVSIAKSYILQHPERGKATALFLNGVLLDALEETFPCP